MMTSEVVYGNNLRDLYLFMNIRSAISVFVIDHLCRNICTKKQTVQLEGFTKAYPCKIMA